jgi:hypothetical protein
MSDHVERQSAVEERPEERGTAWGLAAALVLLALVLVLAAARRQPPDPKPVDAPAGEFSGGRAREILADLQGDGSPHPIGSPANAAVRDRILAHLRGTGYEPTVEARSACNAGTCAQTENVIARLAGTHPTGAVLLMAHYDSVPGGPGAADDTTGVAAILEVARILKAAPPPRNDVIFLLNEGEEAGLLGALAFVTQSPLAGPVKAVVNLEARGTAGPSVMFETIGDNGWTVEAFAADAPHPVTSSVFSTIYSLMPNDTDLSVFKHRPEPVSGINFAFIANPTHYHSTMDRLENVSPASIQHHGDNALAAVRGLAQADLANHPRGNVVFFDVLGATVVRWPAAWTLGIALLALLLVLAAAFLAVRRRTVTAGGVALGFLSFLASVVLAALAVAGLSTVARGAFPSPWVANPLPVLASFWLISLALVGFMAVTLGRRARALGTWAGAWLGWAVLGLLLVVLGVPGISYLFLVPTLVAGAAGLALSGTRGARGIGSAASVVAVLLPALVAGVLWFPILIPLYEGLGSGALVPIGVLTAILFTAIAPLFVTAPAWMRKGVPLAAVVVSILCLGATVIVSPYSPQSPQSQNIVFHQDADTGKAHFMVEVPPPLPASYRKAAPFTDVWEKPFPWSPPQLRYPVAPVPPVPAVDLPAPQLAVLEDTTTTGGRRHVGVLLTSPRGAREATVFIPEAASLESIKVNGTQIEFGKGKPSARFGWYRQSISTLPAEGAELDFVLGAAQPLDWYVLDQTQGLPPAGAALVKARPQTAAAGQDGDMTVVSRKVRI